MGTRSLNYWLLLILVSQWKHATFAVSVGWEYAVIIDAGSTGSRVHVYRYYTASSNNSPWAAVELPESVHRTSPGLSSYAFDPKTAANSLKPLLKYAKEKVPEDQWKSTPVQLMATAGLRMLNNGSADAIMAAVRALLASSGFQFDAAGGARVLTGREEGVWGWVAVNYATEALQAATLPEVPPSQLLLGRKDMPAAVSAAAAPLMGVLELGGASMQVTFLSKAKLPAGIAADLELPGLGADRLYSYSYDGLGLQAAQTKWTEKLTADNRMKDPCLPSGYTAVGGMQGSSDWGACRAAVRQLIPESKACQYKKCGIAGTYLPDTSGAAFLGLDNFYYTARMLGLPSNKRISVDQLDKAASDFCSQNWRKLRSKYFKHGSQTKEPYALKVCFSAAFIISLLKDGLHISPSVALLTASNSVTTLKGETVEANWALGALIVEVLQLGGKAISIAHDHTFIAAVGPEHAASDAAAAGMAASFCLLMLVLTSCAGYLRVGVSVPAAVRVPITSKGNTGSAGGGLGGIGIAISGLVQQSNGSAGGVQSNVRYQRMRALSPTGMLNGIQRPGSAGVTSGGGKSGGGAGGEGQHVLEVVAAAHSGVENSRMSGTAGRAGQSKQR